MKHWREPAASVSDSVRAQKKEQKHGQTRSATNGADRLSVSNRTARKTVTRVHWYLPAKLKQNPGTENMKTSLASGSTNSSANFSPNNFSGIVLSSSTEIRRLREVARPLIQDDETTLDPEFFLASITKGWGPKVVAVYSAGDVVGIMYTKERVISGVPTGIVYGDGSLGGILLSNPVHQQNAFRFATERLLASPGIRGARLLILRSSGEYDAVRQLIASRSVDGQCSSIENSYAPPWKVHDHLPLTATYEQFLEGLGSTTRHNFRYYRRRFEASGNKFIERLSMDELRSAARSLRAKSKYTAQLPMGDFEKSLDMVTVTRRPLAVGLKRHDGTWLSVLGGWYRPGGAVLRFQCNYHGEHDTDSLSTVLRAYLIEDLIQQGLKELVIWGGTGRPLSRYVSYPPIVGVRLDVPTIAWRAARLCMSKVGPHLPRRLASAVRWVC